MDVKLEYRKSNIHCYVRNATDAESKTVELKFEFCQWQWFEPSAPDSDGDYTTLEEIIVPIEEVSGFYLMLLADGWKCCGQY